MQTNHLEDLDKELVLSSRLNKHLVVGYIFLALVFLGAVASVYYWQYKARAQAGIDQIGQIKHVESGEQILTK